MRVALLLSSAVASLVAAGAGSGADGAGASPWPRHTIDVSSRGADGIRFADVDGDGDPDVVTGWEEGGAIRACLNPGAARAHAPWPAVTVGKVGSPEDAVFADLDRDGAVDIVSSCEGDVRAIWFHWAPRERERYLEESAWRTEELPASRRLMQWMFCLPLDVDGRRGIDLVAGGKGKGAGVGWFESPADPRDGAAWRWHPIGAAGWIMSLVASDIDGDGDLDVVVSDRKGPSRGVFWLENPGPGPRPWGRHEIGGAGKEVMFLTLVDLDRDGLLDVVTAVSGGELVWSRRTRSAPPAWADSSIALPPAAGTGKGVACGDIDLDGAIDIAFSCENARDRSGVMWLRRGSDRSWIAHDVSGTREGAKYDLVELLDLDGDGDLDIMTCEEHDNLGVVWYENPVRRPAR